MKKRKVLAIIFLLVIAFSIFTPSVALAANDEDDPWYVDIFVTLFDNILSPFLGISEPAQHVFQEHLSCDNNGENCRAKYWGLYEKEEFNNAIFRGYTIFGIFMGSFFVAALVKLFVQYSLSPLSSTLKLNVIDVGIRTITALLLFTNFFTIVGLFFQLNAMGVSLLDRDIRMPLNLSHYGADLIGNVTGAGERITVSDLAKEMNGLKKLIVNFFSIGISIWFEAFYIQRLLMISALIILSPLWIGTMFFPMLKGITGHCMKELWAQIMSQFIHAALFWLFFWLFKNKDISWLQLIMALAMFIPISESIRFALGATSRSAGMITTAGTLAGAGTIFHAARAYKDISSGIREGSYMIRSRNTGGAGGHASGSGGQEGSVRPREQYGGAINYRPRVDNSYSMSPARSDHQARLQGYATIASGFGRGLMRMSGSSAGVGLSVMGQTAFAEGFASVGDSAGFRMGSGAYGLGSRWMNKTKDTYQRMISELEDDGKELKPFQRNMVGFASGIVGAGRTVLPSKQFSNDPIYRRAAAEQAGGVAGAMMFGRGGYDMGADFATSKFSGITSSAGSFAEGEQIYTVETQDGSWLARKADNGEYDRISNVGRGNISLVKGQQAIKEYHASKQDGIFRLKPATTIKTIAGRDVEEDKPAFSFDSEGNNVKFEGKTVNPMSFIERNPMNHVDIRRKKSVSSKDFTGDIV